MKQTTIAVSVIPIAAVPSQSLSVTLNGQSCKINIYQKSTGLFMDLYLNGSPIFTTKLCRDRVSMTRANYLGFVGDLYFKDTQGDSDPQFSGLGQRYILANMVSTV
ncbi:MAG: hypothetical protein JWP38_3747 [Herbaspirillum sp.]|nr:hypothetical protein [Herbaspirillum sp.]